MARYRIRRENVEYTEPGDHRPGLVQVVATRNGLTLKRILWRDLPMSGGFERAATVLFDLRPDAADPEFVICETRDVILDAEPPSSPQPTEDWRH